MSLEPIFPDATDNFYYLIRFKEGDEEALNYFYKRAYRPLMRYGLHIIGDKFIVSVVVQEAILKSWNYRERMESMIHIYCFARLNVKWGCYGWYKRPENRIQGKTYLDQFIESRPDLTFLNDTEVTAYEQGLDEENLKRIYKILPYLPAKRQTMLKLYFKYGLSYNEIAHRFTTSNQKVSREIKEGLEYLKKIIHMGKRPSSARNALETNKTPKSMNPSSHSYNECLTGELLQIFRLRYEMKLSFDDIAFRLCMSPIQVKQKYIAAHMNLGKMRSNQHE